MTFTCNRHCVICSDLHVLSKHDQVLNQSLRRSELTAALFSPTVLIGRCLNGQYIPCCVICLQSSGLAYEDMLADGLHPKTNKHTGGSMVTHMAIIAS